MLLVFYLKNNLYRNFVKILSKSFNETNNKYFEPEQLIFSNAAFSV